MNYLEEANNVLKRSNLNGVRVCFEQAAWNSSDGNVKIYYHVHVQHDDLPDFNSGIGDSNFDNLIHKLKKHVVAELRAELSERAIGEPIS